MEANLFNECMTKGTDNVVMSLNVSENWPASVAQLDAPSDWRPGGRGYNPS